MSTLENTPSVSREDGLTTDRRRFWDENGFLILPSFFSEDEIDAIRQLHEHVWQIRPANVIVDDLTGGRRLRMNQVSVDAKRQPYKVNDLYLTFPGIRRLALDPRLTRLLAELINDAPVLCNTLSLEFGSEQANHIDSLYMTPPRESPLVATWTALEDCHPDAGPLAYVPGSHRIEPYRFSNGRMTELAAERDEWAAYIRDHVARLGLVEQQFLPRKGDVFIWHGQLLHGGGKRNDPKRTRRSLVSHYFTEGACRAEGYKLRHEHDGYWMQRPPQGASPARRATESLGRLIRRVVYAALPATGASPTSTEQ